MTDRPPLTRTTASQETARRIDAGLRGAAVGLLAMVTSGAGTFGVIYLAAHTFDRCLPHEYFCFAPGLVPGLVAAPILLVITGPLAARALRLRPPMLFALPVVAIPVLEFCAGAIIRSEATLIASWVVTVAGSLAAYAATGVWSATRGRSTPGHQPQRPGTADGADRPA
ncbi:hypothetical protein Lfu02_03200 [Longispora fulva]|uniref:TctA family transporter n=1 Tax=Longispora fulva TaxID=619741 RepID=A0A8J7GMJ0_9ACTN|nr:hypothetical protein [Longispora fulva]MBG6135809.1 TctA family transporter [Longispora fulva]GIG55948.1 hypothetical protein Lfu02_03200 [Longispora fulva]